MYAEVGGFKEVYRQSSGSQPVTLQYTANVPKFYHFTEVRFDVVPPKHCTQLNKCINGTTSAVSPAPYDITTVCTLQKA